MIVQEASVCELTCNRQIRGRREGIFHWHENYEICRVVNLPCRFRVDGRIIQAQPGDVVVFREQTVHQFLIDHDNTEICVIQFHPRILLNEASGTVSLREHITREEILAVDGLWERLEALTALLKKEKAAEKADQNGYMRSLCTALYCLLRRHFPDTEGIERREQQRDFYQVVEYINAHFDEHVTVNSIAGHFHFSRGKLSVIFKRYAGISVSDYTNTLRVKNANALLTRGATVTEAALSSGFESTRTFNNVYKRIMGMTPSEYLNKKHTG
ncbi:MAG: helix-turn-helix transcriptional regulator [Clostridia bacterium]|nr:helix-turn-helix transcriptional regulator [Clostridia bacterium]